MRAIAEKGKGNSPVRTFEYCQGICLKARDAPKEKAMNRR